MAKRGQKTKRTPELEAKIIECFELGMIEKEVAKIVGVSTTSLTNWKAKHPEFFASVKIARLKADNEVEGALLKSAKGYDHKDKHYPPHPTSMIFWLKNRKPAQWRDRVELEHQQRMVFEIDAGDDDDPDEFPGY